MTKVKVTLFIIIAVTVGPVLLGLSYLSLSVVKMVILALPFDFSQDYRKIPGVENILFLQSYDEVYYKRCFWGLEKTGMVGRLEEHQPETPTLAEEELQKVLTTDNRIEQASFSPDGNYILYCERDHNYLDDPYLNDNYYYYCRVYEIKTGKITTIYQGFRTGYDVIWLPDGGKPG